MVHSGVQRTGQPQYDLKKYLKGGKMPPLTEVHTVAFNDIIKAVCGATKSMSEVDGTGGIEVAEHVNYLKVQENHRS